MLHLSLETKIPVINKRDSKVVYLDSSGILAFSNTEINLRINGGEGLGGNFGVHILQDRVKERN